MTIKIATISLLLIVLTLAVSNPSKKVRGNSTKLTAQTENRDKKNTVQSILDESAKLEKLAGDFQFIEGPIWHPDGFLLFSDIPANIIYKFGSNQQVEVFRRPSGKANGNTLDKENRLLTAEHENRRVSRTEKDGKVITLADRYQGKRLNSPNDLVVKSDGSIYFTDPSYGVSKDREELGFYGVYRLAPDGKLTLLVKDLVLPNGIAFSPDEQKLYVNNSEAGYIAVFDVKPDGTVTNERLFAELKDASQSGVPDGLKVDLEGNVYSTGPGGVWIFSRDGKVLGKISVPETATNLAWGESDRKTLYITASKSLYRIRLKIAGVRAGKRSKIGRS
ncbi:Gluconolactonase [Oscillatoria nigro-viridis PCC 7112]|uniref:Gluconolactonase n=1 Tax=Phormidium nigroviride PCC 7112 TaxID=179408 RepID=K9VEU3_9CYAN|nr:SMP-30/gluconolactonase/LRE family protein [Oscillatoria nigro-viridis]AFZ06012.1 Gluconolactonase [Oscillatoria nigro-viridis PCC 7112]